MEPSSFNHRSRILSDIAVRDDAKELRHGNSCKRTWQHTSDALEPAPDRPHQPSLSGNLKMIADAENKMMRAVMETKP